MKISMRSLAAAALLCLGALAAPQAHAQTFVVASCPSVTAVGGAGQKGLPYAIDTKGNICSSSAGGGGGAVTIADGADVTQGAIADAAYAGSGNATTISALKGIYASVNGAIPAGTAYIGKTRATDGTNDGLIDPCQSVAKNSTPINISTATTTRIVTETSSIKTYICHIHIVTNAANNVALIEGTGASCAGGTPAGMAGGTTAASGWNFSANGGISLGQGGSFVLQTANAAYSVCLVTSAGTQLSGTMTWVQR